MEFDYYYGSQADQFSFIRIPRMLLTEDIFSSLTLQSKMLYSVLLDRMSLSMKNGNQDTRPYNENIEKEYQKLLETLSPEQEEVLTKYCDEIFASGAETEEFFYRLGIKDGLRLKSTVKSVLEMMARNRNL